MRWLRMRVTRLALWLCVMAAGAQGHTRSSLPPVPPGDLCRPPASVCCPWDKKPGAEGRPPSAVAPRVPRSSACTPTGVAVRGGDIRFRLTCPPARPLSLAQPGLGLAAGAVGLDLLQRTEADGGDPRDQEELSGAGGTPSRAAGA